jgi:outer membrane protein OmpA-like peptidoglycan-associated protein
MKSIYILFVLATHLVHAQTKETEYKTISIFFGGGSYYIEEEEKEKVRDFLSKEILSNFEIHIHGHTDNIGGVQYNQWLSKMRTDAAFDFLEKDGIPMNKVFLKDHGLHNPEFDNSTWDGRLKNRRVDIVLWPLPF